MSTSETVMYSGKTYWVEKSGFITEHGPDGTKHHVAPFSVQDIGARAHIEDAIKKMKDEENRRNSSFSTFDRKEPWEF